MTAKSLIVAFLLGALVAGGAVWMGVRYTSADRFASIDRATEEAAVADLEVLPAARLAQPGVDDPELVGAPTAPARFEELQEENRELQGKVEELEAQVEALTPKPKDPRAFRFGVPGRAAAFDKAAWPTLSGHVKELTKVLAEIKDAVDAGGLPQPSQGQIARIVQHNTPLATFAVAFGADIEDVTPNGAYTHPAVIANLMRAALAEAEIPLSDEQEIAILALGNAWIGEQERIVASFPADEPVMAKTVQEVDAKLRFLASSQTVLTAQQRSVLFPTDTSGRFKLDLLSPALVYVLYFDVVAADAQDMAQKLIEELLAQAGIVLEDLEPYAWIGREWVDAIPGVASPMLATSIDRFFPRVERMQVRARAQAAATERILAMNGLTEAQADGLRSVQSLLNPFVLLGGE